MDKETRREFEATIGAQRLAMEVILFSLFSELERLGVLTQPSLQRIFDQADDTLIASALQLGDKAPPEYVTRAMQIVEQIRAQLGIPKD